MLCADVFPNGAWSDSMRGCLQSLFDPGAGYLRIPVIFPPGNPLGGTDLNSLIPGMGAHLACAAATIGSP
jgi:hypothetical protein